MRHLKIFVLTLFVAIFLFIVFLSTGNYGYHPIMERLHELSGTSQFGGEDKAIATFRILVWVIIPMDLFFSVGIAYWIVSAREKRRKGGKES